MSGWPIKKIHVDRSRETARLLSRGLLSEGDVNIEQFIDKPKETGYAGPLTIERETTGERKKKDILKAKKILEKSHGWGKSPRPSM